MKICVECKWHKHDKQEHICTYGDKIDCVTGKPEEYCCYVVTEHGTKDCPDFTPKQPSWWARLIRRLR